MKRTKKGKHRRADTHSTNQAGKHYVSAELFKRGIRNKLLSENHQGYIEVEKGKKDNKIISIAVHSCNPDNRGNTFLLKAEHEKWINSNDNELVVFVWLGSVKLRQPPRYWIAKKSEVGKACIEHVHHKTHKKERRFGIQDLDSNQNYKNHLPKEWEGRWHLLKL